jgi:hypothetical protein
MSGILNLEISAADISVCYEDRYKSSTSSKGNQIKWVCGSVWVKADTLGYEGLSECVSSALARHSNIGDFAAVTDYALCRVEEKESDGSNNSFIGCYSQNFLKPDETLVTVSRLIEAETGKTFPGLVKGLSTEEKITLTVDLVKSVTGIPDFGEWLTCLLEWDMLIYNEDRHEHNIAVVKNEFGGFRLMPLFDNGAGLFSDMSIDYPLKKPLTVCENKIKSKPFNTDFSKQVAACRKIYGGQLKLRFESVESISLSPDIYDKAILDRVLITLKANAAKFNKSSS